MRSVFISTLFLLFSWVCTAQQSGTVNKNSSIGKTEFSDTVKELRLTLKELNNRLDSISVVNRKLVSAQDTLAKYIDDTRLKESLKSAEFTINMQNSWLTGFGTIYTVMTILIAVISVILIVINNNLSSQTREAIKKADDATDRLLKQTDDFETKLKNALDDRFLKYEKEVYDQQLNEMFKDLKNDRLVNQRRLQIEKLSSMTVDKFSNERLIDLCDILNRNLSEKEKLLLVEILIQTKNNIVKNFLMTWSNATTLEVELQNFLYSYYLENGFVNYLAPITSFILEKSTEYAEFQKILVMLPSHPEYFYSIINHKVLIRSLDSFTIDTMKKYILESLPSWATLSRERIVESELFKINA